MEKKLTKKEREELERSLRQKRRNFIEAVEGYWKDYNNAESYLKTKGEQVSPEERERLFRRYEALNDYKLEYENDSEDERMWSIIRTIVKGAKRNTWGDAVDKYLTIKLEEDDLYVDEIIWNTNELILLFKEARKYGFKRIFYMNNSSGAMETIGEAIQFGAVLEGSTYDVEYRKYGLIFNIENVEFEKAVVEDEVVVDDIKRQLEALGGNIEFDMYRRSVAGKLLMKYAKTFGLININNTINKYAEELIKKYTTPEEGE